MSNRILNRYGKHMEKESPFTYRFTDSDMLAIIGELNRKPVHKERVMNLLLSGKK